MLWTITCRRFKRDRRGISNIIVITLSLVIILAIVSNIVLWNYEMTQMDWEKMKENISINEAATHSSWLTAQSE
jgi:high-affinity Fe2+/Pb2+ permease